MSPSADEEYVEAVLAIVEEIPQGCVTTYGLIAEVVGARLARGGPRTVASVMARYGDAVAWWRVVRADGSLPADLAHRARPEYLGEGTPLRATGDVDLRRAVWWPSDIHSSMP